MAHLVAYVTGHGFGHATRTAEVLRVVRQRRPDLAITVVSSAPQRLFARAVGGPLGFRNRQCDVGLVQHSALEIDEEATVARVLEFAQGYPALVEEEARWLQASGAAVVLGDIPPLAFDAAAEAGLPALALGNFSWDWIYRHLGTRQPRLNAAADAAARAYARCTLLLALPFAGNLSAFPRRESVPLVARRPLVAGGQARLRLGMPSQDTVVLFSFGGFGVDLDRAAIRSDPSMHVVFSEEVADRLEDLGLAYPDLVGAADVVVTKPGYGIVSDVIGARRRLVYTDRGSFPEYPIMVREMPALLPAVYLPGPDLRAGRLGPAVRAVLALPMPPAPDTSGAEVAAARLIERL